MMSSNFLFIGFMGVGKSTVGREIAKKLQLKYIDTDDVIATNERLSISDIFKQKGEPYFRACERELFEQLKSTQKSCISVGGGFPITIDEPLEQLGEVIYLKKSLSEILEDMPSNDFVKRPLLKDKAKIKELYHSRLARYEQQATITIDINKKGLIYIIDEIISYIRT